MENKFEVSRRDFIKGSAFGVAGLAAAGALAGAAFAEGSAAGSASGSAAGSASGSAAGSASAAGSTSGSAAGSASGSGSGGGMPAGFTGDATLGIPNGGTWKDAPAAIADSDIIDTYDCDVLVIGLGMAGSCALRAAFEGGAKVCAIEDMSEDSVSFLGGGQVGHINSQYLASQDVPTVDLKTFVDDWQLHSNNRSNPALVMNYAKYCGQAFDWYIDSLSDDDKKSITVRCWPSEDGRSMTDYSGLKTFVGTANVGETDLCSHAIQLVKDGGGKFYWHTKAEQLTTDDSGAVTGAIAKSDDGYIKVTAKSTIIATGDYCGNTDMLNDLQTEIVSAMDSNSAFSGVSGRDGSGIQMGCWAGGRLDPNQGAMDGGYWYPTDSPMDPLGATSALWINADGKRYCNEGFGSTEMMAFPGCRQPAGKIFTVFDSNYESLLKVQAFGHMGIDLVNGSLDSLKSTLDAAYTNGAGGSNNTTEDASSSTAGQDKATMGAANVYAADDLETLGGYLGFEGDKLTAFVDSINHYNELCEAGSDTDFGKDPALMIPVSQAPFYAYGGTKVAGEIMVTVSGLLVDAEGCVLNKDFEPVGGLFAVGNASGGRFGNQYFTSIAGQSLSMCMTMGYITGTYAATGSLPELGATTASSSTSSASGSATASAAASKSGSASASASASGSASASASASTAGAGSAKASTTGSATKTASEDVVKSGCGSCHSTSEYEGWTSKDVTKDVVKSMNSGLSDDDVASIVNYYASK